MSERPTAHASSDVDVTVIGAGPAGCSAALWLSEMGWRVALIEQGRQLLARLADLQWPQNWVLGAPQASTAELAQRYAAHVQAQPRVRVVLQDRLVQAQRSPWPDGRWHLLTQAGRAIPCRAVVVATGLQPVPFTPCTGPAAPLDAQSLTRQRTQFAAAPAMRFLLLGGGDNAVENAAHLARAGHAVTLWTRGPLRAQRLLQERLKDLPPERLLLRIGQPMPQHLQSLADGPPGASGWLAHSASHGVEHFDQVAVLFGNTPDDATLALLSQAAQPLQGLVSGQAAHAGVFVAGDLSGRWHPCIATAIADGAQTARDVQAWLEHSHMPVDAASPSAAAPEPAPESVREPMPAPAQGTQILTLTGLRFDASLGILDHEKAAPQPIRVDAELNLGPQPLMPQSDAINHVLDYRKVRQIIIDECTAQHVNLLESLIGKLAHRLLQLPGVVGVRVKIAKLEIFDDCEVAIRAEAGRW